MKILFISPYVPNLVRVRPYNLIRALSANGHQITLFTLWSDQKDVQDLKELAPHCAQVYSENLTKFQSIANCLLAVPGAQPLQYVYCWQPTLAQALLQNVMDGFDSQPYDVIHIEHLRGAKFGAFLQQKLKQHNHTVPIVWDSVDSISHLFKQASGRTSSWKSRLITTFELHRTERQERLLAERFHRVLVTSPVDQGIFQAMLPQNKQKVVVIPNGVDLDYFQPDPKTPKDPLSIVLSGKMSYHANVSMALHFYNQIMPFVWQAQPKSRLVIVGKDPTPEIVNLGNHPNVEVTGTVQDIRPYLHRAMVAVAPITYGAGIQNKVLEAMACGTAVVSSRQAVSAIQAVPDRDLLVADHPEEFAHKILQLLDDGNLRQKLQQNGRLYLEQNHRWSGVAKRLEGFYRQAMSA